MVQKRVAYAALLKDPRWQKKRLQILERDDWACRLCGDKTSTLHVHHLWYARALDPWDYPEEGLVTACESCHGELHEFRPGDNVTISLVAGGAQMGHLYEFAETLRVHDGPDGRAFTPDEWDRLLAALAVLVGAVRRGASVRALAAAIEAGERAGGDGIPEHA